MPNWCYTNITFNGSKKNVEWLNSKLKEWTSKNGMDNGFGLDWLGNIVINSGLANAEDIDNATHPACRGRLIYVDINTSQNSDQAQLIVDTETAWSPMLQMWVKLNEKYNLDLEIIYSAEECGCELYCTNDPCEANKYRIDVWEDINGVESEWFATESYVVKILQQLLNNKRETNIDRLLKEFYDSDYSDNMSINRWEFVPIEDWC